MIEKIIDTQEDIEEELELGPQMELLADGSVEVDIGEEAPEPNVEEAFDQNLAEVLPSAKLEEIVSLVMGSTRVDKESRSEWESTFKSGLKLIGVELTEGTQPFEGACTATHPLIIEAAVKYQSKTIQEIFQPGGPARVSIVGAVNDKVEAQANRVKSFLNYQICYMMSDYYILTERTLLKTALAGTTFRKIMPNYITMQPEVENISLDNFIISDDAVSLAKADRYTHIFYLSKSEMRKRVLKGHYLDAELGEPVSAERQEMESEAQKQKGFDVAESAYDAVYEIYEQHRGLALGKEYEPFSEDDDIELPYVVTVEKNSNKVLSIYRNWRQNDPERKKIIWFVDRHFVPGPGFYSYGLIHLFGNSAMALTFALRALIDAGQFATLPAGLKSKGLRITGGGEAFSPGEWRDVESVSTDLSKSLFPLPYKEPSKTLFDMLQWLDGRVQKFADSTENVIADSTNLGPVGTTLALLEASAKFEASLHKRNHQAQKKEYELLAFIDGEYLIDARYPYAVEGQDQFILKSDFDARIDILPVSDPNGIGGTHRLALAAQQIDLALKQPQIFDMREVFKRYFVAAGVQELDKLLPMPPQAKPLDPISDIATAVRGLPIKAFPGQHHQAHIAVETAWLNDPRNGSAPIMQGPVKAVEAHIRDHMMQLIIDQMAGLQGQPPPSDPQAMAIASAQAEAAKVMLEEASGLQLAADIERANLQLQAADLELRRETAQVDAAVKGVELALKKDANKLKRLELGLKGVQGAKQDAEDSVQSHLDRMVEVLKTFVQEKGETLRAKIRSENKKVEASKKKE